MSRAVQIWRWGDPVEPIREIVASGGMLAVPTESSYGLAADPRSLRGVETVFRFKARSGDKPLPVVAGDLEQLAMLGVDIEDPRLRLLASLWPAPLSLVVPISRRSPAAGSSGTLAVRIPDHPRLVGLLRRLGFPLTATSANSSGERPLCDPVALARSLSGWPALIVDDGILPGGPPSTMVALRPDDLEVLRVGRYPIAELRQRLSKLGWSSGFSASIAEKPADHPGGAR